ncbi:MAG TPA: type II toxin-antitoxin system VapC family toxin [Candidatus Saccharimonadales bacterium]|jgi:predicted nucleic acid-binding protein|nr:type II toxin-antitoxin system VapC family toxin [Candidatus Saccharimonadales bacterium]
MTVIVDSDILIEVSRGRDKEILSRWEQLGRSENHILCSPVTEAELWAGARPREHEALTNLFSALGCAPIDSATGRQAGDFLRQYHKSHGLELGDALIASAALLHRAELWTRNRKHYPMKELFFY